VSTQLLTLTIVVVALSLVTARIAILLPALGTLVARKVLAKYILARKATSLLQTRSLASRSEDLVMITSTKDFHLTI